MKKPEVRKRLIKELQKTPIILIACNNVGISRNTYYKWAKKDPKFREKMLEAHKFGVEYVNGIAESQTIKKIQNGDFKAITYWLDHRHSAFRKSSYNELGYNPHKHVDNIPDFEDGEISKAIERFTSKKHNK